MIVYLVDIAVIIIIGMFIRSGFKNGMIRSFLFLLNSILSWILSIYVSKYLSYFISNRFVRPSAIKEVDLLMRGRYLKEDILLDKLPQIVINSMPNYGITLNKITHIISSVSKELLPNKIVEVFMPLINEFLKFSITGIMFILLILVGKVFITLILKLFRLRIINYSDKIVGGILGGLKGYIIISIFACILKVLIPFSFLNVNQKIIYKTVSSTVVFKTIYENNPLYNMFKKL